MRRANWNAWWARDFIVLGYVGEDEKGEECVWARAGDGANESAVEVEDDEVSQLTGEAAVTTEGQDERDERRGTAARSAASYAAALTDIGAEGFHFAALFGNEDAEATSAGGDDADGHESGEAAAAAVAAGESSGEIIVVEGEANASALDSQGGVRSRWRVCVSD